MPSKHTAFDSSLLILGVICALAFFALGGTAVAQQYVLKSSKQHCKPHYIRKTETVKKHEHGRVVKVHETLCVYQARKAPVVDPPPAPTAPVVSTPAPTPTPTPTAPAPTEPIKETKKELPKEEPKKEEPKQIATITKLESSEPEDCSQSFVLGGETETCYFELLISVSSIEGESLSTPTPTYTFTNEGESGKVWSFNSRGLSTFSLGVTNESNSGLSIEETFLTQPHEILAKSQGVKPWKVYASYPGTSKYAASQSTTLSLALH